MLYKTAVTGRPHKTLREKEAAMLTIARRLTYSWMTYVVIRHPAGPAFSVCGSPSRYRGKDGRGVRTTAVLHLMCGSYTAIPPYIFMVQYGYVFKVPVATMYMVSFIILIISSSIQP